MLEISTYTRRFLSCQIWAVPIGAPLTLYMMAFAAETEFCIRWADEQAPQSATMAAMLNSRDLLGTFIFDSGLRVSPDGRFPHVGSRHGHSRRINHNAQISVLPGGYQPDSPLGRANHAVVSVLNLEFRPDNNGRAMLHTARVLGRRPGSGINLDAHHLGAVDEVVDVAGRHRLPRHVVYVQLHATPATSAGHPPR